MDESLNGAPFDLPAEAGRLDHRPRPSTLNLAPTPTAQAPAAGRGAQQPVSCPECGALQRVVLNRRDAHDFCSNCDYPLFWTPSEVQRDDGSGADESLRRLPGTVGRATIASLTCPNCAEPNQVSSVHCVRCNAFLRPAAPPPPPPPAPLPPPPPPPVIEEPEHRTPWWAWLLLGVGLAAMFTLVVLAATGVI